MSDPYRRISKREVYRNPWVAVEVHEIVHPTGAPGEHVLIVTPPAAAILVVENNDFIFARQPRFGARAIHVEVVKGGADDGETAFECAQRELREEVGLIARDWQSLGRTYEIPSLVDKPVELFVARDLTTVPTEQEGIEAIDALRMPIADAYRAALDGRIDDAVTLAALLRFRLVTAGIGS